MLGFLQCPKPCDISLYHHWPSCKIKLLRLKAAMQLSNCVKTTARHVRMYVPQICIYTVAWQDITLQYHHYHHKGLWRCEPDLLTIVRQHGHIALVWATMCPGLVDFSAQVQYVPTGSPPRLFRLIEWVVEGFPDISNILETLFTSLCSPTAGTAASYDCWQSISKQVKPLEHDISYASAFHPFCPAIMLVPLKLSSPAFWVGICLCHEGTEVSCHSTDFTNTNNA